MKKALLSVAVATVMTLSFSTVNADDHGLKSEKQAKAAVEFRKALLQLVRSNMGPLGAMAKGNIPMDEAVIATNALRIEQLALMMEDYFEPDTCAFDVSTDAKDEIWDNFADFSDKTNDLVSAAKALQETVASGQSDNYRQAIGKVGGTCKACHDEYKKD